MSIIKVQEKRESGIRLHSMKKIEVIVSGENEAMIAALMTEANLSGFTLLRNISGTMVFTRGSCYLMIRQHWLCSLLSDQKTPFPPLL